MSISPHAGHPTFGRSSPIVQIAGQTPRPFGIFARTSIRPYFQLALPSVLMLPEV